MISFVPTKESESSLGFMANFEVVLNRNVDHLSLSVQTSDITLIASLNKQFLYYLVVSIHTGIRSERMNQSIIMN